MVDKFYTIKQNVDFIYSLINLEKFDLVIEPSAGDGVFLDYLLRHNIPFRAYDIEPHHASIQEQDFLTLELDRPDGCNILTIGNPPFGTNNSLVIRFFNKAADFSSSIALILPKSFRKPSVINRLDRHFHLIADVNLPTEEYRNGTNLVSVPTFFQVWDRGDGIRPIIKSQVTSDKIAFVGQDDANYTIRRVGAKAGIAFADVNRSKQSHYFIYTELPDFLTKWNDVVWPFDDDVGCHSLTKGQIIEKIDELF